MRTKRIKAKADLTVDIPPAISGGVVRVLVEQSENAYMAQCLEYDIAAEGATVKELEESLIYSILAHIELAIRHDDEPFSKLGPAPRYFFDRWESVYRRELGELSIPTERISKPVDLPMRSLALAAS